MIEFTLTHEMHICMHVNVGTRVSPSRPGAPCQLCHAQRFIGAQGNLQNRHIQL